MKEILKFPDGFLWGAATSSFQVEGGINNCDWAEAAKSGRVVPAGSAVDHYHRYEEDFDLAASLGHSCHRLSIEWARIEPEEGNFDMKQIEHYKKVLSALHNRNIVPFVTLWHFTLPQWFAQKGGFTKKENTTFFVRYCNFVIKNLKNHCKNFSTINEPMVYSSMGYLWGQWPPFEIFKIEAFLKVVRNMIRAHKQIYVDTKKEHGDSVLISIVKNNMYMHVSRNSRFNIVYHILKKISHYFWNEYFLKRIHNYLDAIDVNYYFHSEYGIKQKYIKSDMGWDLYPQGLYYVLKNIVKYRKPIRITEAGIADERDIYREQYIKDLIHSTHQAIQEGVDIEAFMYWSLLDNYEWSHGFSKKFGLISVDYRTKKRTIRQSAYAYKKICEDNAVIIN